VGGVEYFCKETPALRLSFSVSGRSVFPSESVSVPLYSGNHEPDLVPIPILSNSYTTEVDHEVEVGLIV